MKRIELLDYGRLGAAFSVMAFHYLFNGINNGKISSITYIPALVPFAKYGYLGVEFFFMISGYVIFFSATDKTAGQFLTSRAVRLFPAFWAAVIFTSTVAQFLGGRQMAVGPTQFLLNLTMFPNVLGQPYVDGVYWTLQYEWCFYFLVFCFLVMGLQSRIKLLFVFWPAYILAAQVSGSDLPYGGGYYCYFVAGALFAIIKREKSGISLGALLLCAYLCISFSSGQADVLAARKGVAFSGLVIASIILLQFLLFAFITTAVGSSLRIPGSRLAGALTYPIYLIHAHFGYMIISRFANEENKIAVIALTASSAVVVAYLINVLVERRLSQVWVALFSRSVGVVGDALQDGVLRLWRHAYCICLNRTSWRRADQPCSERTGAADGARTQSETAMQSRVAGE